MALNDQEFGRLQTLLKTRATSDFSKFKTGESFGADALADVKQIGTDLKNTFSKGKENIDKTLQASIDNPEGNIGTDAKALAQSFGQGAGTLSGGLSDILKGVVKAVLPQGAEDAVKGGVAAVATPVIESAPIQSLIEKYDSLSEDDKRSVDALLGVTSLATDFAGAGLAAKGAKPALNAAKQGAEAVVDVSKAAVKPIVPAVKAVGDAAKGVKDVAVMGAEALGRVPAKVATNVAEKQAAREAIESLTTDTMKNAARDGIEIPDVQTVSKLADSVPAQKNIVRELIDTTKKFAEGKTKTNPIEIVGKPIVQRLKTLEAGRQKVGQELGKVADTLAAVTTKELATPVFNALKKVPGLSGLTVSKKGVLDFADTTLATALTKSDRQAIQKIFVEAVKGGTGKQKHLLRQELFEVLDGKKKSLANLTDTQDKAYQAIRKALSDVLESKNPRYKTLSNQYRKIVQPLSDMRKMMKEIPGASEDILDMKAGLLARRLTSNAASNPQIRAILRAMDDATGVKGKTTFKVEELQDLYNVLDKYYDIAGKTGFQGQIKNALDKDSRGLFDFVSKTVGSFAGETPAVRQKALEALFEEVLK